MRQKQKSKAALPLYTRNLFIGKIERVSVVLCLLFQSAFIIDWLLWISPLILSADDDAQSIVLNNALAIYDWAVAETKEGFKEGEIPLKLNITVIQRDRGDTLSLHCPLLLVCS